MTEFNQLLKTLKIRPKSQKAQILALLHEGYVLDDMNVLRMVGCWSLSQRIGELSKAGVNIKKDWAYNAKNGKRYMTYRLENEK